MQWANLEGQAQIREFKELISQKAIKKKKFFKEKKSQSMSKFSAFEPMGAVLDLKLKEMNFFQQNIICGVNFN